MACMMFRVFSVAVRDEQTPIHPSGDASARTGEPRREWRSVPVDERMTIIAMSVGQPSSSGALV